MNLNFLIWMFFFKVYVVYILVQARKQKYPKRRKGNSACYRRRTLQSPSVSTRRSAVTLVTYLGRTRFQSRPEYKLCSLRCIVVLLIKIKSKCFIHCSKNDKALAQPTPWSRVTVQNLIRLDGKDIAHRLWNSQFLCSFRKRVNCILS
jgi:hypothetical protein